MGGKNDQRRTQVSLTTLGCSGVGLVVVLGLLFGIWHDAYWITQFVWEGRRLWRWILLLVLLGACVVIPFALGGDEYGWILGSVGFVIGLVAVIWIGLWSGYQNDRSYVEHSSVVTDPVPGLAGRAPFLVGKAQAGTSLGDIAGDVSDTTYLADQDRFATLVVRRGWLSGYASAFTQHVPLSGRGEEGQRCDFDTKKASARIGGRFGHSLARQIAQHHHLVTFDNGDVYSYCDGTTPIVVVPLKRQVGWFGVTERPAGIALYNGRTGKLTLTDEVSKIPGPTYPISLAKQQRQALTATGSFTDWLARRVGWVGSDDGTNAGNDAEFTLNQSGGGGPLYVTPLTPHGTTSSIVAVSTVAAQHSGEHLAPLTVHRLAKAWVSPEALVARIRADYSDACCYNLDKIFEVIPTGGDNWVATMGNEQNLTYRVTGNGQLQGAEATCLLTADGRPIRCGPNASQPVSVPKGTDIKILSNEELLKLQGQVAGEVARRLRAGGG